MKQLVISALLAATSLVSVAQDKKNEISVIGGIIQMNMNPGENGLGAQLQYSRQLHPWFGVEGRLGMGRYNDFPASSTFKEGDSGLYSGWGIPDEFDAYIRAIPASDAITTNWQTLTLISGGCIGVHIADTYHSSPFKVLCRCYATASFWSSNVYNLH